MSLVRWDPFVELDTLRKEINNLFSSHMETDGHGDTPQRLWSPRVDIAETDDEYVLYAELPGVNRDDIELQVTGDTLTLKGERHNEHAEEGTYHRSERYFGTFLRTFTFTAPLDAENVKAACRDGVLEVRVPKASEAKPKRIAISDR